MSFSLTSRECRGRYYDGVSNVSADGNEFTSRRTRTGALCTAECSSGGFNCAWCRSKDRQLCGHLFGTWLSWSETHQSVSVCAVPKFSWKSVPDLDFGSLLLSLSHEGLLRVIWATIDNVVVLSACVAVAFLNQNPLVNYSFYFIIKNIQVNLCRFTFQQS